MQFIKNFYFWILRLSAQKDEKGLPSAGRWQHLVRERAYKMLSIDTGVLLEIGCGEGFFILKLINRYPDLSIIGFDKWQRILHFAKKRLTAAPDKFNLICGNVGNFPFKNNAFDTIVCVNMIYNLPKDSDALALINNAGFMLKKGGEFIFDIRNRLNPLLKLKYFLAPLYDDAAKRIALRGDDLNIIRRKLDECNFSVCEEVCMGFGLKKFAPLILIRAKKQI